MNPEELIKKYRDKPDSDMVLDIYYAFMKCGIGWKEFMDMPVPLVFEMLERMEKESKEMQNVGKKTRKHV